jgi:hypothetical protein
MLLLSPLAHVEQLWLSAQARDKIFEIELNGSAFIVRCKSLARAYARHYAAQMRPNRYRDAINTQSGRTARFLLNRSACYHEFLEGPRCGLREHIRWKEVIVADTTKIKDKTERKKLKRAARKKAAPKAKRTAPRGSLKKKVKKMVRGQSKR